MMGRHELNDNWRDFEIIMYVIFHYVMFVITNQNKFLLLCLNA